MEARMGAMQACGAILRKVDGGIKICVLDLVESPRAIENGHLQCLADRFRTVITSNGAAE
jgi:hypothetical protein